MITKKGTVIKISGTQTVKVRVEESRTHEKYHKKITTSSNFMVHDEKEEAAVNDIVAIKQTRPVSKTKTWALESIITKAA